MAQVKYEPFDENLDDMDTSMQNLIEQADCLLDSLRSRSSYNSSSSSTANESTASTSRESTNTSSNAQPERRITMESVSSVIEDEPSDNSSGSDTTILCGHEEVEMPTASTPIAMADESIGQEVIVIGTPVTERRNRRRTRRNADISVIDLTNYQEPAPVVIISSDEEDNAAPRTVEASIPPPPPPLPPQPRPQTSMPPSQPSITPPQPSITPPQPSRPAGNYQHPVALSGYAVAIRTPPIRSISVQFDSAAPARPGRANRQPGQTNTHRRSNILAINIPGPMPARIASLVRAVQPAPPRAAPPCHPAAPVAPAPAPTTNLNETRTSRAGDIICPICYETLANRKATSTYCGHVFCAECLRRSLQLAKKCPVCKKGLTNAKQMHPLYFATE